MHGVALSATQIPSPHSTRLSGKPLTGVWATAPYPHSGSVPNIYWLLKPHRDRPKKFPVGIREYDPINMGFQRDLPLDNANTFDTSLPGNSAMGHEFAVDLTDDNIFDLIEYLKTL